MTDTRMRALGLVALSMLAGAAAQAQTASLTPDKDNTLFEMLGLPDLSSGQGDLFAGGIAQQNELGNAYRRRSLLHFNLSSIPAGATITSATLRIQVTKTIAGTYQFDLYRMLADWGEGASNAGGQGTGTNAAAGDATWNYRFFGDASSAWATPGGDFSPDIRGTAMIGGIGNYTFTGAGMVADVQAWVNGNQPNYGWMMTSHFEFLTSIAKRISSGEASNVSARPTLIVNYTVPSPGVGAVLAGGLALAARRRRRV
ncbi:MAG TPA: DNRLRE domain-containing protein [Phycisphaerales bacterium]|nr:DNRLRE domain-containing protein [Phycisphaerales bacterium]